MFGLPRDLDLGFMVGCTLLQVCVGQNEVILRFDREVSITIESRFLVRDPHGGEAVVESAPRGVASLVSLLADSVIDASGNEDGTLRLSFGKGEILEVYDSSKEYESYQIQHGKDIHVI